ncbi:hypothetical protein [Acinetobacter bereziniae]|uniref:hypothetical protein n=1 Tax=Acinetobacter bereziniae TaxID=106648 RepID=UPI00111668C8|nr:hypothetical protein [Acinetobacter bereziniae]TNL51604.1 hypothetical protein EYB59_07705 [Acinetobacter bereziniae]TNL64400.1 hypothetical protein EYY58_01340 [Acinetobacter bereziniae]
MKISIIALTLLVISMPVMAQSESLQIQTTHNSMELNELSNVFDYSKTENIQALELSKQEMKDTEGAWAPAAIMVARIGIAFFNPVTIRKAR